MSLTQRVQTLIDELNAMVTRGDAAGAWDQVDRLIELDEVEGWSYRVRLCRLPGPGRLITAATLGHLGGALLEARRLVEAAESWSEAGEVYDAHDSEHAASMWESAGMAFGAASEYGLAREAYMRALDSLKRPQDPTYRDARIGLSRVFANEKNYDEAFSAAWWGLRLPQGEVPDSDFCDRQAELWLTLGGASIHLHRHSLAEYAYRSVSALTDDPSLVEEAAEMLELIRESGDGRGLASGVTLDPSERVFHVAWVGANDSMVARVDAGVFLLPDKVAVLGEPVSDPRT